MARLANGYIFVYREIKEDISKLEELGYIGGWLPPDKIGETFLVTRNDYVGHLKSPVRAYCIRMLTDPPEFEYWVPYFILEKSYYKKRIATYE